MAIVIVLFESDDDIDTAQKSQETDANHRRRRLNLQLVVVVYELCTMTLYARSFRQELFNGIDVKALNIKSGAWLLKRSALLHTVTKYCHWSMWRKVRNIINFIIYANDD